MPKNQNPHHETNMAGSMDKQKHSGLDRHSGMGVDPNPKKGGFKGWGKPGVEEGPYALDERDPNYVDPNEEADLKPEEIPAQIEK